MQEKAIPYCLYRSGTLCFSSAPQVIDWQETVGRYNRASMRFQDTTIFTEASDRMPRFDIIPGALWQISYKRRKHGVAVLLEQRSYRETFWDFCHISPHGHFRISFKTRSQQELYKLNNFLGYKVYACTDVVEKEECSNVLVMRELIYGHAFSGYDEKYRNSLDIARYFYQTILLCDDYFSTECFQP